MSDRKGERERKEKKIEIFTIRIRHGSGSIDVDDKHETEILSPQFIIGAFPHDFRVRSCPSSRAIAVACSPASIRWIIAPVQVQLQPVSVLRIWLLDFT